MEHRCEVRIVIGWNRTDRALFLRSRIDLRINTADEPEDRWNMPFASKGAEILARHGRSRVLYVLSREVRPKRITHSLGRVWIIRRQRIAVERSDLRLARRA